MGDDDIDLLAEISDDPDDEDSDYGRGWQDGYRAGQAATPDGPRRCVHETWRCDHCHDDPPPGHICPACGAQPVGPLTDATPAADGRDGDGRG